MYSYCLSLQTVHVRVVAAVRSDLGLAVAFVMAYTGRDETLRIKHGHDIIAVMTLVSLASHSPKNPKPSLSFFESHMPLPTPPASQELEL